MMTTMKLVVAYNTYIQGEKAFVKVIKVIFIITVYIIVYFIITANQMDVVWPRVLVETLKTDNKKRRTRYVSRWNCQRSAFALA